jgi:DNA adenine methylase
MTTRDTKNITNTLFDEDILSDWSVSTKYQAERIPPKQFLKWVGNKQRFAQQIATVFPIQYNRYIEPFVGSGAVLGAMSPHEAIAGDALKPLIDLWTLLKNEPEKVYEFYSRNHKDFLKNKERVYKKIRDSYNENPNGLDLLFLSRSCYGGIVRFTKQGKMSTPPGAHTPIPPEAFKERMMLWRNRILNTEFLHASYEVLMDQATDGDIVYCDPPYSDSQSILYGAQSFKLQDLFLKISEAKKRGAKIALSIDGKKFSGSKIIELNIPDGLFNREIFINLGSSMLKRFQKKNQKMVGEDVYDRLLLTW